MNANGIPRKLARKVAWAVAMSTAAYGIEAIWEDQKWLLDGFTKLTTVLGRTVAGTFSTAKGEDAIRAADIPPPKPTLDRRRERLLASALAAPRDSLKRTLILPPATDDSSRHRLSKWFKGASGHGSLLKEGQATGKTRPRPWYRTPWASPRAD